VNGKYDAVSLGLVLPLLVTRCLHKIHQKFCDLLVAIVVVVSELKVIKHAQVSNVLHLG